MIDIHRTAPEDYRAASATVSAALMHAPMTDEDWTKSEPSWVASDSLSAWDGDRCVGHVAGYRVDTVVPGGATLATSAVSRVGVLATHRRRGLASTLMHRLLSEAAERRQVLASLRASEGVIYHRFGFGIAGDAAEIALDPIAARPVRGAAPGSIRLLAPSEIHDVVPPLYTSVATRPGVISRPDFMWHRYIDAAVDAGGDAEFVAVHADEHGQDDGFVHYGVKWREQPYTMPTGEGKIMDLWGSTPAVELALWSFLCELDLVRSWRAEERPIDDHIRLAIADPRAYQVRLGGWDEQWLRLLDVDAALRARAYGPAPSSVTIAVHDDLFEPNTGVWSVDSAGAERADGLAASDADLAADIATVSATYLGGVPWSALAAVGRVEVRADKALTAADHLFRHTPAPFCGSFF